MEIDEEELYSMEEDENEEDSNDRGQPAEELETVTIGEGDPLKTVKVGTTMVLELREGPMIGIGTKPLPEFECEAEATSLAL
ncbi:hypothetical protein LWI29_023118 [Acer saccharum]|uniref:Uncharacterized protein n=1 Tax=Acer saccharum TaxID=4024 RepID=A0AA39RQM4_ACESA|nr:hypothetical protein LWI29_023118 [Acer saccharum]